MKAGLSVGLLPDNKNIYIVASGDKEFVINNGVTLRAIDANGEKHSMGGMLSADYFFKLVTNALDEERNRHPILSIFPPAWGIDSEFSSEGIKKREDKAWEKFRNKYSKD